MSNTALTPEDNAIMIKIAGTLTDGLLPPDLRYERAAKIFLDFGNQRYEEGNADKYEFAKDFLESIRRYEHYQPGLSPARWSVSYGTTICNFFSNAVSDLSETLLRAGSFRLRLRRSSITSEDVFPYPEGASRRI